MNFFTNYVLSKYKSFNDQDPQWMSDHLKPKAQQKTPGLSNMLKTAKLHLMINGQLITNFRKKAVFFKLYFAKKYTPIENDSY